MKPQHVDLMIIGAGPVGLACAYLAQLSGLSTVIIDKSEGPLTVGRADALNARSLQLFEIIDLFDELYPLGKPCNTSSVWSKGKFISRQSTWWEALQGCFHKHFLMIGQAYVEQALDNKLTELNHGVRRNTSVQDIVLEGDGCLTTLSSGEIVRSRYVIGADGSRSFVRQHFAIPFEITRPQITWAVIDGEIETDFPKVPEIIVFQAETADVAWIPREGKIDRFYIQMDSEDFTQQQAIDKINHALQPHYLRFKSIEWYSQFSVKESVAEHYGLENKLFIAGDASHIHSVNGGQGLNTGLADAFNLIWKMAMITHHHAPQTLLQTYETERKAVALEVVKTSAELVRSTKTSDTGTHADDYVKIVEKRAGYITGMGVRYGTDGRVGERLHDFMWRDSHSGQPGRIYSHLNYRNYSLLIIGSATVPASLPDIVNVLHVETGGSPYSDQYLLVRPDGYIAATAPLDQPSAIGHYFSDWRVQ
ncbi:FAD-binding protein [Pectobacterium carotovorum subsp. carotovorum]|nr:FAD-binding protein [Pectobacterium carotovorum]MCL6363938.1 FAD-binding protein [Pectobacterium carotovorum subsp. carotovorum]